MPNRTLTLTLEEKTILTLLGYTLYPCVNQNERKKATKWHADYHLKKGEAYLTYSEELAVLDKYLGYKET
jgi:hypothetical protein